MDQPILPKELGRINYVVVAGFGLPGRTLVDALIREKVAYTVVELNSQTCERAAAGGICIIPGSASDFEILQQAGIERADLVALMVPNDEVVLAAIPEIRRLNRKAYIIARCSFTSSSFEASRRGADRTIVSEQVVARELEVIVAGILNRTGR